MKKILLTLLLSVVSFFSVFFPVVKVSADNQISADYTYVIDDLSRIENFDVNQYPADINDYSLNFLSIMESTTGQLFLYLYQPSAGNKHMVATSVNMSNGERPASISDNIPESSSEVEQYLENALFKNYKLSLLNSSGVFFKYLVEGYTVQDIDMRTYEISSVFRAWNSTMGDKEGENGNTISEVSYPVAKMIRIGELEDSNGLPTYHELDTEVIHITSKYIGLLRYKQGIPLFGIDDQVDSHYIAFDTDKVIDKLMEADVMYTKVTYNYSAVMGIVLKDEEISTKEYVYLNSDNNEGSVDVGVFFPEMHAWKRICTVDKFIETEEFKTWFVESGLTDESIKELKGKKWVLRFVETEYDSVLTTDKYEYTRSRVSDVSILRLKFETNGVIYNLGVVDNKQTGDGIPDNYFNFEFNAEKLEELLQKILMIIGIVLLVVILIFCSGILSPIFSALKFILKVVIYVITLPFRILGRLFRGKK
ncbi:MAG: hypothetical protein IJX91_01350 [Clostridia bacterium]|nr:hypothetical protein [Clostridia bacterium]